jgi:hypothetical protein
MSLELIKKADEYRAKIDELEHRLQRIRGLTKIQAIELEVQYETSNSGYSFEQVVLANPDKAFLETSLLDELLLVINCEYKSKLLEKLNTNVKDYAEIENL